MYFIGQICGINLLHMEMFRVLVITTLITKAPEKEVTDIYDQVASGAFADKTDN